MDPFMVLKRKSAERPRTKYRSILPLMVPKSEFSRGFSAKETFTPPLTVLAVPEPAMFSISTLYLHSSIDCLGRARARDVLHLHSSIHVVDGKVSCHIANMNMA